MKRIFAEGTIVDEFVGLGVLAGMLTVDPHRKLDPTFREALHNTAMLCKCPLGNFAITAIEDIEEFDGEMARFAARKLANAYFKKHIPPEELALKLPLG